MKSIVIDLLGGDSNTLEILKGLQEIYEDIKEKYQLVLAGPEDIIRSCISDPELVVLPCEKDVTNTTNPMGMLHDLEDTALVKCYSYLREHEEAAGLITVASTGCVLVGSIFKLGLIHGIKAPVLATELLDYNGKYFLMADCGANVDAQPAQLLDFAKMGNAYMKGLGVTAPRVGLANIGAEPGKGNKQMKEAYKLLEASGLNFVGNIEFNAVFNGMCDVLVTDGAIGNCILKNTEGVAELLRGRFLGYSDVSDFLFRMHCYNSNGAAILLGPKKIVLKAHGAATSQTICSSLRLFERLEQGNLVAGLEKEFAL